MKKRKSGDAGSKNSRKKRVNDILASVHDEPSDDVSEEEEVATEALPVEDSSVTLRSCSSKDDGLSKESSFQHHLCHILKVEEANKLNEMEWRYKWKRPVSGMSMSHWMGTGKNILKDVTSIEMYGLKPKLYDHWLNINKATKSGDFDLSKQDFFLLCSSYRDILHCNKKPFYHRGRDEDSSFMDAYIMHALNHVYHTRELVTKNDSKLTKHQESMNEDIISGDNFLDQGFTRPKVLFLLPFASIAFRVVKRLIQLTPLSKKDNVEHIDRFNKEFGPGDVEDEDEDEDEKNDVSSKSQKPAKPVEFQMLLGGNTNDHFMVGIKFTKRSLKLYSDFYSSDIIVASPLGLITRIGEAEVDKEKDVDYLSSIELLIIDHADVIAMQNWSHLKTVVEQMNHTPSKQHGTDVMRIRQWYLNGHARYYRQTVLLGSFLNPDMCGLFNQLCLNYEGKVILKTKHEGVLSEVLLQVRQVYERFDVPAITDADDARFDYFCKKVFPKIKDSTEGGIMIFISSSLDYLRVKYFLKCQDASYCEITEFSKRSDIPRTRNLFHKGDLKIMLYTERAYFYHRYKIRGIKNLIVYSLPERKEFFPEITNMLEGSDMVCRVLYSRFDLLSLEKVVGTDYAKKILSSDKGMFVCSSS